MSTMATLVARHAIADYARRPLNLLLLVLIPVVLVFVWGNSLADFSKLFGGSANRGQVVAATAGRSAAALAGLAGFSCCGTGIDGRLRLRPLLGWQADARSPRIPRQQRHPVALRDGAGYRWHGGYFTDAVAVTSSA